MLLADIGTCWRTDIQAVAQPNQYDEAEPLYVRALAISEKVLGPDHPDSINVRKNYADLVRTQKRLSPS